MISRLFKSTSRAVTLAELLVAMTITGFVLAGVFAAEHSLRKMDVDLNDYSADVYNASALVESIRSAVRVMHGDLTTPTEENTGFVPVNNNGTFCFRTDVEDGSGNFTPNNYADDSWTCFTLSALGDVFRCTIPSPGPDENTVCPSTSGFVGKMAPDCFLDDNNKPVVSSEQLTGKNFVKFTICDSAGNTSVYRENASGF